MKYWLLRFVDILTKIIIAGFIAVVILVATTVSLVRYYLPLVENYHQDILHLINEGSDNFEIRAAVIQGSIDGLRPEVSLYDVTVLAKGQDEVIKINELRLSLDIIRTLSFQKLFFGDLYLSNLDLMLVQSDSKLWGLRTVANKSTSEPPKVRRLIEQLWAIDNLTIDNIKVTLDSYDNGPVHLPTTSIKLVTHLNTKKLYVEVLNQENNELPLLELYAQTKYSPYDKRFKLQSDMQFNQIDFVKHLPLLSSQFGLDNVIFSAKTLLQYENEKVTVEGGLQFSDLVYQLNKADINTLVIKQLDSQYYLSMSKSGDSLSLNNTNVTLLENTLSIPHLKIRSDKHTDSLYIDSLDIAALNQSVLGLWMGSERKIVQYLKGLNASGFLSHIYATVEDKQWQDFSLVALADKVNIDFYNNIPAVDNASGSLALSAKEGEFAIDSEGFNLHLENIFSDGFQLDSAEGLLTWQLYLEDSGLVNRLNLSGQDLLFSGGVGEAAGEFVLDIPLIPYVTDSKFLPPTLSLQIALENSQAKYLPQFLPLPLPSSISDWVHGNVKSANVSRADYIFHGAASKFSQLPRVNQLKLKVDSAEVSYLDQWPSLKQIAGNLSLDDTDIQAEVTEGSLLGVQIEQAQVLIKKDLHDNTLLSVNGSYKASSDQIIGLLGIKPIAEPMGNILQTWQASSNKDVTGNVKISLPLSVKSSKSEPVTDVIVNAKLVDFELRDESKDLHFSGVSSNLTYSLKKGLSTKQLTFDFLGESFNGRVESLVGGGKVKNTRLYFNGNLAQETLYEWLQQPMLDFTEGNLPISGHLYFGEQGGGIKVVSDLKGFSMNLPEPFGKDKNSTMPFELEIPLSGDKRVLTAKLNDLATIQFRVADHGFDAGRIIMGIKHAPFEENKLLIGGQIKFLEVEQWLAFVKEYAGYSKTRASQVKNKPHTSSAKDPSEYGQGSWNIEIDELSVRYLSAFDQKLERAQISVSDHIDYWSVSLNHELLILKSRITNDDRPINLNVQFVDLSFIQMDDKAPPAIAGLLVDEENYVKGIKSSDNISTNFSKLDADELDHVVSALSSTKMADLPDIDVQISKLMFGVEDYGEWEFQLRASEEKVALSQLRGIIRGIQVMGNDSGSAFLSWSLDDVQVEDEAFFTLFRGRFKGENLRDILQAWGYPPQVNSKSFVFDVDLKWLGAPTDYTFEGLYGSISTSLESGSFEDAASSSAGALKFLSALSLNNLLRRVKLDFSDLTDKGLSYDTVKGAVNLDAGVVSFDKHSIDIIGSSSKISLLGQADLNQEMMDFELSVTLPLASNLPWIVALAAGLPTAAGVYVISKLMKTQVEKLSSAIYHVSGDFSEPEVKFIRLFDKH